MKKWVIILLCYPIFLIILLAIDSNRLKKNYSQDIDQRFKTEENFDLSGLLTLDGSKAENSLLEGKTTLIQFSFYGCGPCQRDKRRFPRLLRKADDDFQVITISTDSFDYWKSLNEDQERWIKLNIANSDILNKYEVTGFPTYYILDEAGKIVSNPNWGKVLEETRAYLNIVPNRIDLIVEFIMIQQDKGGLDLLLIGYSVTFIALVGIIFLVKYLTNKVKLKINTQTSNWL